MKSLKVKTYIQDLLLETLLKERIALMEVELGSYIYNCEGKRSCIAVIAEAQDLLEQLQGKPLYTMDIGGHMVRLGVGQ